MGEDAVAVGTVDIEVAMLVFIVCDMTELLLESAVDVGSGATSTMLGIELCTINVAVIVA